MTIALATLGIEVDATGAIKTIDVLAGRMVYLGNKGEELRSKISGSMAPSLGLLEGNAGKAHLGISRLTRGVEALAIQATGASPVIGKLTGALGEMALGGGVVTGVLAGVAAVVGVYDLLTSGARKAREEQDKMTDSLVEQARAARAATLQGADNLKLIAEINLQKVKSENIVGSGSVLLSLLTGKPTIADSDIENHVKRVAYAQTAVDRMDAIMAGFSAPPAGTPSVMSASGAAGDGSAAVARYNEFMARTYGNYPESYRAENRAFLGRLNSEDAARMGGTINADVMTTIGRISGYTPGGSVSMPSVGINDGLTKEQIRTREKMGILVDDSNKNADKIKDAVWGSAAALAGTLVSALNLGGGGKGSTLGGAIGSTAGFALGFGPGGSVIGGAIGSLVGNIAGSLLGGLFDHHKKSVDKNTDAINNLTAALYNAPNGYKVAGRRYQASDGRWVYDAVAQASRTRAMRGGTAGTFV